MPSFFDRLFPKQTKLLTQLEFISTFGKSQYKYPVAGTTEEFVNAYQALKKDLEHENSCVNNSVLVGKEFWGRESKVLTINISVNGKLKGKAISYQFHDLNAYHAFLNENALLRSDHHRPTIS